MGDRSLVAEASAVDIRRQIAQATARAYLTVVAQHRLIAASETARSNAKDHFDYAHTRLAGGVGRSIDEVRAEAGSGQRRRAGAINLRGARAGARGAGGADGGRRAGGLGRRGGPRARCRRCRARSTRRPRVGRISRCSRSGSPPPSGSPTTPGPFIRRIWRRSGARSFRIRRPCSRRRPVGKPSWCCRFPSTTAGSAAASRASATRSLAEARANLEAGARQARSDVRISFEAMLRADEALGAARDAALLAKRVRSGDARLSRGRQHQHRGARRRPAGTRRRHPGRRGRGSGPPSAVGSAGRERPVPVGARRGQRPPKIAVPTRTMVAPSAMASRCCSSLNQAETYPLARAKIG